MAPGALPPPPDIVRSRLRRARGHRPGPGPLVLGGRARLRGHRVRSRRALPARLRRADPSQPDPDRRRRSPRPPGWPTGCARRPTWTGRWTSTPASAAGPRACRPGPHPGSARPCGPRTRSASPSSSSARRRPPTGSSSATTCAAGPRWRGWTTSTSWSPTCRPRTSTTPRWASACPRRSRTPRPCTPPGCSASRPCTTWPSPAAPGPACTTWASSRTRRTRCCASATSSARCTRRGTSSAAPAATGCPTPSTSTCAIRTATGWRSTPATTTPAIPDHPVLRWDVSDPRRRSFYGHAVVPSWYAEASTVLDLDGRPRPVSDQHQILEYSVGADGFPVR